ncbi:hypothetical protein [Streptomyces virginiae]|uniref:Uncharacterized protein n=1 Tax=Streptomyces virginiae TaxID=1961 RepID=A0ABZ1TEC7_STRVG|nr:hypothetical protein [Streptomyces virginiae]MCX4714557.1 hypothetical protein [Streptomyces virginiae]MCX5272274.1 hypothetical protein [Streptomyces virginiae]
MNNTKRVLAAIALAGAALSITGAAHADVVITDDSAVSSDTGDSSTFTSNGENKASFNDAGPNLVAIRKDGGNSFPFGDGFLA